MPEQKFTLSKVEGKEFIKTNTIKEYFKKTHDMRSTEDAVQEVILRFSTAIEKVLIESVELAKKKGQTTVLLADVQIPIEKVIGKKYLSWEDILKAILRQNPTDLANISKGIRDYIEDKEKKSIPIDQKELTARISKEFNLPKSNSEKIINYILSEIVSGKRS